MISWVAMARRPDPSPFDNPLTREEVLELRRHLSSMDPFRVERAYQQAYERCRLHAGVLPRATAVLELVTAWNVLWERKRSGPQGARNIDPDDEITDRVRS
jgi:hypothetical protein